MKMRYNVTASSVDLKNPLIYMWEIHDLLGQIIGRYIGKANGGDKRPTQHYPRNVDKLLQGLPYKKGKNYRQVHYALADAVLAGHPITLTYLCNVSEAVDIFKVESRYINEYGCNADDGIGLNGKWRGVPREVVDAVRAVPVEVSVVTDPVSPDLDDFLEYFDDKPREAFEVRVNAKSCSVWSAGSRILRAKQSKLGTKVLIKLVQSSTPQNVVEFAWNGTDDQLGAALEAERRLLLARDGTPLF
jgi:hypothetical protein